MAELKTVAFLPLTRTNWPIFTRLAAEIQRRGLARPLIIITNPLVRSLVASLNGALECVDLCIGPGVSPAIETAKSETSSVRRSWRFLVRDVLRSVPFLVRASAWIKIRELRRQTRLALDLLKSRAVTAVVVAGDRNTGFEPPLLRAAGELGINRVIAPTAASATVEGLFVQRRQNRFHFITRNNRFKNRFPNQWRHDPVSGEDISYLSVPTTVAYARLGMLPVNPWVLGGGFSDSILVDSVDTKAQYEALGVESRKIVITGHPDHDDLYRSKVESETTRKRLIEKYGLDANKKIIIVCLPNWGEMKMKSWEWHWRENEFLCQTAIAHQCNVLLSLHPSQDRERYQHLEQQYAPLKILEERLSVALSAADVYLTGFASSTVPWGVLCEVPVVIADHYLEKDHMHVALPGVSYVPDQQSLSGVLRDLIYDNEKLRRTRALQKERAARYGVLDGRAMDRIIENIVSLPK